MINWFVERKPEDQISIGKEYEAKITLPIGKLSGNVIFVTQIKL